MMAKSWRIGIRVMDQRRNGSKTELKGLSLEEVEEFVALCGEPSYRGRQLFQWIYARGCRRFEEMTDLPAAL
ncbi:MAG: putative pyruvate formate lyase activating enzyme 2 (yfgB), partial [candidate division NC10 bacterium]|nr:putative pyruvate formate lyase activating enzyme 2 (yfgB) [candidate division NC10 bacterium]